MPRTLTAKVTQAALLFLVLTAAAGWVAITSIRTTTRAADYLTKHTAMRAHLNGQFEANVFRAISESISFARTRDPEFREEADKALEHLHENVAALEALDAADDPDIMQPDSQPLLREHRRSLVNDLQKAVDALFQAIADKNASEIDRRLAALKAPEDQLEALDKEIDALFERNQARALAAVHTSSQEGIYSTSISFGLFAAMVLMVLMLLRRLIVQPIKQLSLAAGVVARGDFDQSIAVTNDDEIGELQRDFNQMVSSLSAQRTAYEQRTAAEQARVAAEQANRAKSAFLAHMSHELRTPLSAIIGYSELIATSVKEPCELTLLPDIQKIQQAGQHLLTLINDILDVSKIEAGKIQLELEHFEIAPLIGEVVATVQPLIAKNRNRLDVDCPADIGAMRADPTRLRQVLLNLLGNAAKFTEGGTITLRVSDVSSPLSLVSGQSSVATDHGPPTTGHRPRAIRFEVTDTGIGISEEQLKKLFQPFTQASAATSRLYGGTGLGLTLSRHLARMMDGDITVTSELGQGSTFTLTLPAQVDSAAEIAPLVAPALGQAQPSAAVAFEAHSMVLVIDDDPAARELIARSLPDNIFTVVTASSGEEGLQLARDLLPEVIILDVQMPGMDGWSVLSALKTDPELSNIPVVMLTIVEEQHTALALGAAEYLIKPVERQEILQVARRLIATHPRQERV